MVTEPARRTREMPKMAAFRQYRVERSSRLTSRRNIPKGNQRDCEEWDDRIMKTTNDSNSSRWKCSTRKMLWNVVWKSSSSIRNVGTKKIVQLCWEYSRPLKKLLRNFSDWFIYLDVIYDYSCYTKSFISYANDMSMKIFLSRQILAKKSFF